MIAALPLLAAILAALQPLYLWRLWSARSVPVLQGRFGLVELPLFPGEDGARAFITDLRLRMLKPHELKLAQGFPASYRLEGTQEAQIRAIGNSVPPPLAAALVRAALTGQP